MPRQRTHDLDLPVGIRRGKTPDTLEVRVTLPPAPGSTRHRQVTKTVRGGVREAQRVRAELLLSREQRSGKEGTVAELLLRWLDLVDPSLSPNTMKNYRAYTDRYLIPALGNRQVRRLTTYDIDAFYSYLEREKGLAPATIRQAHAILSKALGEAVRWKRIPVNPATDARRPRLIEQPISPPDVDTYQRILRRAREKDEPTAVFVWLAGSTAPADPSCAASAGPTSTPADGNCSSPGRSSRWPPATCARSCRSRSRCGASRSATPTCRSSACTSRRCTSALRRSGWSSTATPTCSPTPRTGRCRGGPTG